MSQNPGVGVEGSNVVSTKTPLVGLTPTFATVGVTSSNVVASDASRTSLVLINTSTNTISFGIGSNPAVLYSGITLVPNGVWESDEYSFVTSAIQAIASGANSNLSIQQFH